MKLARLSRTLLVAAAIDSCHAPEVGLVECSTNSDCGGARICGAGNRCEAVGASGAAGGAGTPAVADAVAGAMPTGDAGAGGDNSGGSAGSSDAGSQNGGDDQAGEQNGGSGGGLYDPPIKLDDFELGINQPNWAAFSNWQCYTYNPPNQPFACAFEQSDDNSNFDQWFEMSITDAPDDIFNYTGGGIRVLTTAGTVDFSRHEYFVFEIRLANGYTSHLGDLTAGPLPADTTIDVSFGCSRVTSLGSVPGGFNVVYRLHDVTSQWVTYSLPISEFAQPEGQAIPIDAHKCLTLVDGINFGIQPKLMDGQSARMQLALDNFSLQ